MNSTIEISIPSLIAIAISSFALLVAISNYRRKAGIQIQGSWAVTSSISCDDDYISNLVIENQKDRAITIFSIYLKIGHNYYVQLEDFEDKPLVLKAYESYHKDFDPLVFYEVSMTRVKIDELLKDKKIRKQLVISTSNGKYTVPSLMHRWNPVEDFFRNHMTAVVRPVRSTYKGRAFGSNIVFLIEVFCDDGKETVIPIHPDDYQVKRFANFQLTKEALESKESLIQFIQQLVNAGSIQCVSFKVHDLKSMREKTFDSRSQRVIDAKYYSFFRYYVLGRIATILGNRKLRKENRLRALSVQKQKQSEESAAL